MFVNIIYIILSNNIRRFKMERYQIQFFFKFTFYNVLLVFLERVQFSTENEIFSSIDKIIQNMKMSYFNLKKYCRLNFQTFFRINVPKARLALDHT